MHTIKSSHRISFQPIRSRILLLFLRICCRYMKVGVENTSGKLDRREQIEYAVEYPKSSASTGWPAYERLKSTNPWPSFQPTMRKSTNQFVESVCQVADCIRDSLCLALTLDPQVLSASFEHPNEVPHWAIKMISYPPKEDD